MNMLKTFPVVALLVLASGCASVPLASKEDDAAAKTFSTAPDKSRIYVYRNELLGAAVKVPITLDGKLVGSTLRNTYFVLETDPGSHDVGCVGETPGSVKVDLKPGEITYVWQEMKMGMWAASCAMHVADAQEAQKAIAACTLAVRQ